MCGWWPFFSPQLVGVAALAESSRLHCCPQSFRGGGPSPKRGGRRVVLSAVPWLPPTTDPALSAPRPQLLSTKLSPGEDALHLALNENVLVTSPKDSFTQCCPSPCGVTGFVP